MNPRGSSYTLLVCRRRTPGSAKVLVLETGWTLEGVLRRAVWKPFPDRCPSWPASRALYKVPISPAARTQFWLVFAMYTHVWAEFRSCQILTHRQNFCSKHMAGNPGITCSVGDPSETRALVKASHRRQESWGRLRKALSRRMQGFRRVLTCV